MSGNSKLNEGQKPSIETNKKKRRRKIILLSTLIPLGVAGATTGIVFGVKACNNKNASNPEIEVIGATWDQSKSEVALNTKSTIVLVPNSGEEITSIKSLKIGDDIVTDFTFNKTTCSIIIKAEYMTSLQIQIEVVSEPAKEITGLSITPSTTTWKKGETFKATNLTVKLKYEGGTESAALTWGTDYSISKDGTIIADFSTTGYTFTDADATAGKAEFSIVYLKKTTITDKFTVGVQSESATLDEFLKTYADFIANYASSTRDFNTITFDQTGATWFEKGVTSGSLQYEEEDPYTAYGTFSTSVTDTGIVAGWAAADLKTYLQDAYIDSGNYTMSYSVSTDAVTFKAVLKDDTTKYETITFDNKSYVSNWVNTFSDTGEYKFWGINLTNIKYSKEDFTIVDGLVTVPYETKQKTGTLTIPETVAGITVIGLADGGCVSCYASEVKFENSDNITTLGVGCFTYDTFTKFEVPKNVRTLQSTFNNCESLASVTFETGSKLQTIGKATFMNCGVLESITIPASVRSVNAQAFSGCTSAKFTSATFADTTKTWYQTGDTSKTAITIDTPGNNAAYFRDCETKGITGTNWGTTGIQRDETTVSVDKQYDTEWGLTLTVSPATISETENVITCTYNNPTAETKTGTLKVTNHNFSKDVKIISTSYEFLSGEHTITITIDDWTNVDGNTIYVCAW